MMLIKQARHHQNTHIPRTPICLKESANRESYGGEERQELEFNGYGLLVVGGVAFIQQSIYSFRPSFGAMGALHFCYKVPELWISFVFFHFCFLLTKSKRGM
ncbi:hypothetical protein V6N13_044682 [Hibiscus sabdariffa]|uniref:Uncharacterized protein n=1 Tax=Hibiscus sabdariffa TaxID=183260 RepID=A0ABR2RJ89_9ROSI